MSDQSPTGAALILDRDDTLIVDSGYMSGDHPIVFVPGAVDLAVAATQRGVPLFIATNQSGISRGLYGLADMHYFNARLLQRLEEYSVPILDLVYCPHGPNDGCLCRKPSPGLLLQLQDRHGIKLENSVVVGDKASDEQLGKLHCREGIRIDQKGFSPALIARILSEFNS